jgi:YHS domain-containing protein
VAVDPICGRTVDESVSLPPEGDEAPFCFCGERCRSLFLATLGTPEGRPPGLEARGTDTPSEHGQSSLLPLKV